MNLIKCKFSKKKGFLHTKVYSVTIGLNIQILYQQKDDMRSVSKTLNEKQKPPKLQ